MVEMYNKSCQQARLEAIDEYKMKLLQNLTPINFNGEVIYVATSSLILNVADVLKDKKNE